MVLEQCGYHVLQANSGAEGLRLLRSERVHVAIIDFWLPDMDGAELVREIRRQFPEVRIALLTGSTEYLDPKELNVDVVLSKPILPEALQEIVRELLQRGSAAA
jgi:two-component system, OmpR family, response regulator